MNDGTLRRVWILPGFTAILVTVLLVWLAGTVADLLLLLFVAVLAAVYLSAVTDLLVTRLRVPRGIAFTLTLIGSLAALVGIGALLIPPVVDQARQISAALPTLVPQWETALERALARIPGMTASLPSGEHRIVEVAVAELQKLSANLVPKLFGTVQAGIDLIAIVVMALFLALDPRPYRDLVVALTPPAQRDTAVAVLDGIAETLRAWTIAQLLVMVLLAILTWVGLAALQVPYALAFGIFTGLVALVPFFGTFVSTVLPALFVLPSPDGGTQAVLVVLLGTAVHIVGSHVIVPLLMHRKVDLPPVLTIMSVLVCGRLLGPLGLLVAVPLLAVVMVIVRRVLIARVYGDTAAAATPVRPVESRRQRQMPDAREG